MKKTTNKIIALFSLCLPLFIIGCQKDASTVSTQVSASSADEISDADAPGNYTTASGLKKLVLQPGNGIGQDAWIDFFNGYDSSIYNNGNSGSIDQFKCEVWTMMGGEVITRSLIRFDELSQIPSQSSVKAAKLFLYGLSESQIHLPQGNSYYPGSPYDDYGPNDIYVQRVTSPWDESTVTWNTQPSSSVIGESVIPPSTSQWNYNASVDVTNMVKYFVNNPSANYGFLLKHVKEKIYRSMGFRSSENDDAAKRPKLVIIYK